MTTPMLTLDYDALNEVALKLPAVKSTKPWRDVNSLATTCKGLYEWKKTVVDNYIQTEWSEAKKKINEIHSWRLGLEAIISGYENSPTRLFREPILRKISERYPVPLRGEESQSYGKFRVKIFIHRETVSLREVRKCITACSSASLNSKSQVVEALPALLPALSSAHRQQALRLMFELLDSDKDLGASLKENYSFDEIEESLGCDHQSKTLLELGLFSRELLSRDPKEDELKLVLSHIPEAKRWFWVLENIPECLKTTLGMRIMLTDAACQTGMIDYLDKLFSECVDDDERLDIYLPISEVYSKLDESEKGKKLIASIDNWFFFKLWVKKEPHNSSINHKYAKLLCKELDRYLEKYRSIDKQIYLRDKLGYAISFFAAEVKEFEISTSLLIAIARSGFDYGYAMYKFLNNKDALKHALSSANNLPNLTMQYNYVSVLKKAAQKYFKADLNLIAEMIATKNAIKKSIAVAKSKH
jgi:hypothetical protein